VIGVIFLIDMESPVFVCGFLFHGADPVPCMINAHQLQRKC